MTRGSVFGLILVLSIFQINCKYTPPRYQVGIEIHGGSKPGTNTATTKGNRSYGETCNRLTNECEPLWTYSKGRRCQIDLICYEGKCECPHPLRFWADTTTKTCRRKAGVDECDIQSDNTCVPNAICVMEEIIDMEGDLGYITKCVCRSGCVKTRVGFCKCVFNFSEDPPNGTSLTQVDAE